MDTQQVGAGWDELAGEIRREMVAWRKAHPRATLVEIEQVVEAALSCLHARYLHDLTHASAAADLASVREQERPRCSACGGRLKLHGQRVREVLTPRQAVPLRLRRSYAVCSACGAGLFPPGRGTGAAAG